MEEKKVVTKFLKVNTIISIASTVNDIPWIFTAFYAVLDEGTLVFLSGPSTEHGKQLKKNKNVSASVYSKDSRPGYLEGAQIQGIIEDVKLKEIPKLFSLYTKVMPIKVLEMDLKDILKSLDTKLYKLKIKRIKYRNDKDTRIRKDLRF